MKTISLENLKKYHELEKDYIKVNAINADYNEELTIGEKIEEISKKQLEINSLSLNSEGANELKSIDVDININNDKLVKVIVYDNEENFEATDSVINSLNNGDNKASIIINKDYSIKVGSLDSLPGGCAAQNVLDTNLSKYAWYKYNLDGTTKLGGYLDKETLKKIYDFWGVTVDHSSETVNAGSFNWEFYKAPNGNIYQFNPYGANKLEWGKGAGTHQVGKKLPNDYGIYDLTGNVEEYVKNTDGTYTTIGGSAQTSAAAGNPKNALFIERNTVSGVKDEFKGFRVVKTHGNSIPENFVNIGDFDMSIYEITKKDYKDLMPADINGETFNQEPSTWVVGREYSQGNVFTGNFDLDGETPLFEAVTGTCSLLDNETDELRPVETITEFDAMYFCNMLSASVGLDAYYTLSDLIITSGHITSATVIENDNEGFRLPTIAEWKKAAHGKANTYYSGCNPTHGFTNLTNLLSDSYPYTVGTCLIENEDGIPNDIQIVFLKNDGSIVTKTVIKPYINEDEAKKLIIKFAKDGIYKTEDDEVLTIEDALDQIMDAPNGALEDDVKSSVEVGGISKGEEFTKGTAITDIIKKLLEKYYPAEAKITSSITNTTIEIGTIINPILTATATKTTEKIASIAILRDGVQVEFTDTGVESGGTLTHNAEDVAANTTFTAKINDGKQDSTASISYTFVSPYFSGVVDDASIIDYNTLNKIIEQKGKKAISYTANNKFIVFAYPKSYGVLKSIMDPNNFENISSFTSKTETINSVEYYVYVSNSAVTCSNFKYTFSY